MTLHLRFLLLPFVFALFASPVLGQNTSFPSVKPFDLSSLKVDYKGNRWVKNVSKPYNIKDGLVGRHLYVSPSHGRYFNGDRWRWQRPTLFCTTEDLLTQSFVFPYLIPMLENAGAIVYAPRERDPQTYEAIVDNDQPGRYGTYEEWNTAKYAWQTAEGRGFSAPLTTYNSQNMPFEMGTARCVPTTREHNEHATATWTPLIPKRGRYAVYVSYASLPNSVSDAHYTVHHAGGETSFRVNQRMGGGTWLYLGTFLFDEGRNERGRVVLHNESRHKGVVTADAVRFGGGMGIVERSIPTISYAPDSTKIYTYGQGVTSGLPRQLEGARYYAQLAGLPDSLYNLDEGRNDYSDDIRSRSHLLNLLSGGSAFVPDTTGRGVPFELAFALHTDAGYNRSNTPYGTLGIVTTYNDQGDSLFRTGIDQRISLELGSRVLNQVVQDLSSVYNTTWPLRELRDKNYGETRSPLVPSMILELLAHQNYRDMTYAHDPNFKFTVSRAIYKSLLRYVSATHGQQDPVVQPLPVSHFSACLVKGKNQVHLSWQPTPDPLEPTATPVEYIVYTRTADSDFDNGRLTNGRTTLTLPISPDRHYIFRVAAINAGGESFPSQPLSVYCSSDHAAGRSREVLIVNAFDRLSGPARVETADSLGFDLDADAGVACDYTTAYCGRQTNFSLSGLGKEGPNGLGYGSSELMGKLIAGNRFDGVETHAEAMIGTRTDLSISSVGKDAFLALKEKELSTYDLTDYVCGLEKDAPYNLLPYKTFPPRARQLLRRFSERGGRLLVSGSFVGSDMQQDEERDFLSEVLNVSYMGSVRCDTLQNFRGLQVDLPVYTGLNTEHFACPHNDVLEPTGKAFSAFAYGGNGYSAGVAAAEGHSRTITMGFPFECISDSTTRRVAMDAMLRFLLKQ